MKAVYLPVYIFSGLMIYLYVSGRMPLLIPLLYLLVGIITYAAYARDKSAARRGEWRVSEASLHSFSLAGGWPAALIAQQRLRHKTRKRSFQFVFWTTSALNVAAFGWLHFHDGGVILHSAVGLFEGVLVKQLGSNSLTEGVLWFTALRPLD